MPEMKTHEEAFRKTLPPPWNFFKPMLANQSSTTELLLFRSGRWAGICFWNSNMNTSLPADIIQEILDSDDSEEEEKESENHQSEEDSESDDDDDDDDHSAFPFAPSKSSEGRGQLTSYKGGDPASILDTSSSDDESPPAEKRKETSSPLSPLSLQPQSRRRKTQQHTKSTSASASASFRSPGSNSTAKSQFGDERNNSKINWNVKNTGQLGWDFDMEMGMGTGMDMDMGMDMGIDKGTSTRTSTPLGASCFGCCYDACWMVVKYMLTSRSHGHPTVASCIVHHDSNMQHAHAPAFTKKNLTHVQNIHTIQTRTYKNTKKEI
jgi:hypothetical protein